MQIIIAGTDRTSNLIRNSIRIEDELQEKANKSSFRLSGGSKPSDYDEVKLYESFDIEAVDGTTITLDYDYYINQVVGIFRLNEDIWIDINEAGEIKKTISAVNIGTDNKVKLTVTPSGADGTVGKTAGKLRFAGNIVDINDSNQALLENIEYRITALDYTRVFDKRLINDTFEDKDARYIINSFCNTAINKNTEIDEMNYADNTAIQAEWTETGDGNNPTVDASDYQEGTAAGIFAWTNAGGTATFTASPASLYAADFSGAAAGNPTKGVLGFWYKCTNFNNVTSFDVRIGSDNANYIKFTITPADNDWNFEGLKFTEGTVAGNPDWTVIDYLAVIVTETADSSIRFDGFRFLEEEYFRHFPYVQESALFDDFRIARIKPTETMQRIADELAWYWYIDYERNIHLFPETTNHSPFDLDESSNNFDDLSIQYDTSRLINRQVVKGGDEVSESKYSQVVEGDSIVNEWIMKNKFKNLEVFLDDGSSTDLTEAGTNTTNITIVGHGLATGDYIVNRTRSNAVREITKVNDDNFTVTTVTGQTTGDTLSLFVVQAVGVEGLDAEAGNDYMSNFNEKSIRGAEGSTPIVAGEFLLFRYNEVFPILVQRSENVSIANMVTTLGHTDGIFDGQPVVDRTIKTRPEAVLVAQAVLNKYANVVITAKFKTNRDGLKSGQLINIKDTTSSSRSINQTFVIQRVIIQQVEEGENLFTVTCSGLLFGMLELLQQILKQGRKLEVEEDATINNIEDAAETITISDAGAGVVDGNKQQEDIIIADGVVSSVVTPPFQWQPGGANPAIWNLFSWG